MRLKSADVIPETVESKTLAAAYDTRSFTSHRAGTLVCWKVQILFLVKHKVLGGSQDSLQFITTKILNQSESVRKRIDAFKSPGFHWLG